MGRPRIQVRRHEMSLLGGQRHDRVERRVYGLDPGQHGGEKFGGGKLTGPDEPGEFGRRGSAQVHRQAARSVLVAQGR